MKTLLAILVVALVLNPCDQADAKRHIFKEFQAQKVDDQLKSNTKLNRGVGATGDHHGAASSMMAADKLKSIADAKNEKNSNYGSYSNVSGSSSDSHHVFPDEHRPPPV